MKRPDTLAEAARRINAGEPQCHALPEFLDTFYLLLRSHQFAAAQAAIDDAPPPLTDPIAQAHLGAVGEHLALRWGLNVPRWTHDQSRFLKQPHFTTPWAGFRAILIAESPLAFRRRLIFTEAEPLRRARFPRDANGRALEAHEVATLGATGQWAARAARRERLSQRAR